MTTGPIVKEPTPEQDRVRPLPLVGVAIGSLVAGFLLVYALGQSASEAPAETRPPRQPHEPSAPSDEAPAAPEAPPDDDEPDTPAEAPAAGTDTTPAAPAAGTDTTPAAQPATPDATAAAGDTPATSARGSTVGEAFYFRCWEAGQDDPAPEGSCDRLPALEQRIAAQLSEIEACASGAQGTLSLGIEVQLRAKQASFWAGRRSTITPIDPLIRCVRTRLADTDLEGLGGRFRKYTLFVPIELR